MSASQRIVEVLVLWAALGASESISLCTFNLIHLFHTLNLVSNGESSSMKVHVQVPSHLDLVPEGTVLDLYRWIYVHVLTSTAVSDKKRSSHTCRAQVVVKL